MNRYFGLVVLCFGWVGVSEAKMNLSAFDLSPSANEAFSGCERSTRGDGQIVKEEYKKLDLKNMSYSKNRDFGFLLECPRTITLEEESDLNVGYLDSRKKMDREKIRCLYTINFGKDSLGRTAVDLIRCEAKSTKSN
jgi:hypothetical protein